MSSADTCVGLLFHIAADSLSDPGAQLPPILSSQVPASSYQILDPSSESPPSSQIGLLGRFVRLLCRNFLLMDEFVG